MNNRITKADEILSAVPFGNTVLPAALMESEIMDKIIVEVYNGWPGQIGLERVKNVVTFLCERVPQYAKIMGKTELETLEIMANARRVNYTNWFQDAYFPDLSTVKIFDTVEDFKKKFPSGKYQCPNCKGTTTDYQQCNSGVIVDRKKKEVCDWKVYGLFGGLGEEIKVIVKDHFADIPKPISMFKPVELLEAAVS